MAEINVTPFVDVMLVLLIIFMVAAPLLTVGVPVELPKTAANALPVRAGGTADRDHRPRTASMMIQTTETARDDLVPELRAIAAERARRQGLPARRRGGPL